MDRALPQAVMLYGYDEASAEVILSAFELITGGRPVMFNATGREASTVSEVLEGGEGSFNTCTVPFLMFLGYGSDEIRMIMQRFPSTPEIKRPIFCGLTSNNISWKIEYLLEHLIEERRAHA